MSKSYNDLFVRVEKMVRALTGYHEDAESIVQLNMIKIFEKRIDTSTISSKRLYRIVRNTFLDYCKQQARREKYFNRRMYLDFAGTVCDSQAEGQEVYTPTAGINNIECESIMIRSPLHEEVLELNLHGMNCKEIAKHLGISVGTAKSRLHYARKYNRANRR